MVVDFEDSVVELTDADVISVPLPSRRARLAALRTAEPLRRVKPPRSAYDVCLFVAMEPQWVPTLRYVRGLRKVARTVIVYLFDAWLLNLDDVRRHRRAWSEVDHVFASFNHAIDAYRSALDCDVHYMPQAIDERRFHPYRIARPIDVISLGRRIPSVHQQLRALANRNDIFYYYQTARDPQAISLTENQELLGRMLQSSRVHVNWAVESTDPRRAEGGGPITARWFESAASGGIVVGSRPSNAEFRKLFPYSEFVYEIDPGHPTCAQDVVSDVLRSPTDHQERVALAEHVRAHHTWKARWREIVEVCGL